MKHERGLWGTTFTHHSLSFVNHGTKRSRDDRNNGVEFIHSTRFSPSGDILAVASGKGARVHLVDWRSGAGQVIGTVSCSLGGGKVAGMWWFDGLSLASKAMLGDEMVGSRMHLAVLTSDAEVYLWDVGERRCVRRWMDEGGFRHTGRVLTGTQRGGAYLAIGYVFFFIIYVLASVDTPSPPLFFLTTADFFFLFLFFFRSSSGIVNIYDSTSYSLSSSEISKTPKPIKSIGNLTTAISSLKFNHDAQLLAMTSREKKDSMRLVRFSLSLSLFSKC